MKVSLKSVLKSSDLQFECFEEQQIIFRSGNMLCIKEINRGECRFITLNKHIDVLYDFKVAHNRKGVFTAEKHANQVQICHYSLAGERRSFSLSGQTLFFTEVEQLKLLVDQYDNSLIYGAGKNRQNACIFLLDIFKMKMMAIGFLPFYQDIKIDVRENMTVSVCGYNSTHNYIKWLRYGLGQWEVDQQLYKRVQQIAIQHEILFGGRIMIITKHQFYLFEDNQLLQHLILSNPKRNILQVIKIPKGAVVRFTDGTLKLLMQDSDETTFIEGGDLRLELLANEQIFKITSSFTLEQVVIRSTKHNIYTWRCDHISSTTDKSDLTFHRVQNSCNFQQEGNISISTGRKYCLLTGSNNATLWSIERNQIILTNEFTNPTQAKRRMLFAGAINPDGNSILLAFQDKVRLYNILLTKLKLINEFNIKRCQNIIYSHGGQLAACRYGKGNNACVTIVNMVRSVQICTFKIQSEPTQFVWNQLDDQLIIATETNSIQIFRIAENAKIHHIKIGEEITQVRIDYKTKQLIVSSQKEMYLLQGGKIVEHVAPPIDNFYYMFPLYGVYFIVTKTGELVWSNSNKFETYHQIPLFSNKPFHLICRNGYLLAYRSIQDITVLHCERANKLNKGANSEDIVMIERDQILSFFQKVKTIQNNFQMLSNTTALKIEQQKNKYENAIMQHKALFQREINFLNSKLFELNSQKTRQEKESEKVFQSLEHGQIRSINDLQRMYDRKFDIQKEKFLNLEQAFLQQKIKYEKLVLDVEVQYHRDVDIVRQEYSSKIKQEYSKIQDIKNTNLDEKKKMQMKCFEIEQENEVTLLQMQNQNQQFIDQLKVKYCKLEEQYEQAHIKMHNQQNDLERYKKEVQIKLRQAQDLRERVKSFENRVILLENEIERKNIMIEQKNQLIEQQAHQIGGLEKAKYVLSFRTTQIRKELEPKEEQVDKLKSEIFKLQEQFKQERKKNSQLSIRIQKLQKINDIQKRQVSDLRISLKHRQRIFEQLCSQIFTIVNNVDPKDWNAELIKIYQNYIKQSKYENKANKKKDDTSQQINRHLIHVEESLIQVTSGTERMLKGKEKEVMRKMKENSQLVYQLNVMRKKENQYIRERKQLSSQNARLKRQMNESMRTTTRSQTNYTAFTRRAMISREGGNRQKSLNLDIQQLEKSKAELKESRVSKNRLISARRTLLMQDEKKQKNSRIFDVAKQLQTARDTIRRQDRMIEQLNQRIMGDDHP